MTSGIERAAAVLCAIAFTACNSPKEEKSSAISAIASSSLAVRAPTPEPSAAPPPEQHVVQRAKDPSDLIINDQRRARVESFAPEAKGFLTSAELEESLYKLNLRRGKDDDAEKAFDRLAKGKWILFTGNVTPKPGSAEMPIRYTPKDPKDDFGLTSTYFSVPVENIKGWDGSTYRTGEFAVILAKYEGKKKAGPGYDVVALEHWFP